MGFQMFVRISQPAKTSMQSGTAQSNKWLLEFVPNHASTRDPLTGWVGATETVTQVKLHFDTLDAAKAYVQKQGLAYRIIQPHKRRPIRKTYADNFRHNRTGAWTH